MQVLVAMVLCLVCVNCVALTGKAFYCRDPDSGKLHAVNTTWRSSSFCGNYTCRIRRKNITETEYTPLRQLNVSMHDPTTDKNKTVAVEKKMEPDIIPLLHKNLKPDPINKINNDDDKLQDINNDAKKRSEIKQTYYEVRQPDDRTDSHTPKPYDDGDRYLTENEINSIAGVLHTVKKSDLDAIVDIYHLAQDIYKEMDNVSDEDLIHEALNLIKEEEKHKIPVMKPSSYWYHPFGNKGKMADRYDLDHQGTNHAHSTVKPNTNVPTYFNGPLTRNDFGKLPYYYPLSDFQRMSSYTHQPSQSKQQMAKDSHAGTKEKPCKPKYNIKNQREPESQKLIQPSLLLPYPFASIHHYNISEYPNKFYYKVNPWALDYYNKHKYYQPYYDAYIAPIPKAILVNPHLNEVQDEEQKPVNRPNDNMLSKLIVRSNELPSWKTRPLSVEVLKDIRANIDTSKVIKAFPLRKKVKLDRVGKVIKMDDLNNSNERSKRSPDKESETEIDVTDDFGEYEPFLDTITCKTQIDPGFFRMGNLTHPYPDCCPQKIETR